MNYQMEENIIKAVEKRRVLYDANNKMYKNNLYRGKLWNDISEELNIPADDCRVKWKRLREKYSEYCKKRQLGHYGKPKPWSYLFKNMSFIKPYITIKPNNPSQSETESSNLCLTNFKEENNIYLKQFVLENDDPLDEESINGLETRQSTSDINHIVESIKVPQLPSDDYDGVDYYCLSLAKDLKNMKPCEQRRVKFEINKILHNAKYID